MSKQPVSIAGIEFDALISEDKSYQQEIPEYPTEDGYSISDTIILKPITVNLVLYISNTPVTWYRRHGISTVRVQDVMKKLEDLYFQRTLIKVVTPDAIYTDMGITSMQISKSKELSNCRQVSLGLKKVYVTSRKTVDIPEYILKSGDTAANAGKAITSTSASNTSANQNSNSSGSASGSGTEESKKAGSILFGAAKNFGILGG